MSRVSPKRSAKHRSTTKRHRRQRPRRRLAETYVAIVEGGRLGDRGRTRLVFAGTEKRATFREAKREAWRTLLADGTTVELRADSEHGSIIERVKLVTRESAATLATRPRWVQAFET